MVVKPALVPGQWGGPIGGVGRPTGNATGGYYSCSATLVNGTPRIIVRGANVFLCVCQKLKSWRGDVYRLDTINHISSVSVSLIHFYKPGSCCVLLQHVSDSVQQRRGLVAVHARGALCRAVCDGIRGDTSSQPH